MQVTLAANMLILLPAGDSPVTPLRKEELNLLATLIMQVLDPVFWTVQGSEILQPEPRVISCLVGS